MTESSASLDGMLRRLEQRAPQTRIDLGLGRVRQVLERQRLDFGNTRIVSVAGTNGKGSTVAFLEAIAARAGLRAFAFTSPHLLAFGERFRYLGQPLPDDEIASALRAVERARDDIALTWFEHVTLAAFELAARRRPDWLIAEVGMGGRLDAVNALDADVAVITSIGLDHQRFLGRTRAAIAREKCGIARAGRPVIVAEKKRPENMLETLDAVGARVSLAGRDFDWRWRSEKLSIRIGNREIVDLSPGLAGLHQGGNAAAAAAAGLALAPSLSYRAIAEGLTAARLAGRFQRVAGSPDVIVDVAHNPAAARVLAAQLKRLPGEKVAVFAALEDKNIAGIVRPLAGIFRRWFAATLNVPRGLPATDLIARMCGLSVGGSPEALESVSDALAAARKSFEAERASADPTAHTIIVFGSFYTVAAALQAIKQSNSD
ncbi:MAG TPA: folylpolyglutamate synthase/dihydrofolate synthase family protein [Wenzhouxiangellaceae bacterium]|nr:folylpolyglutamate synthase/dihydrofolate synthase family protein [Wenzhouxiangellaceae bacterium]